MTTPKLYINPVNYGSRSILMLLKALNITHNIDFIQLDLLKQEQLEDWFIKINPQHTVPTFVDSDGVVVWDSHAILIYLVEKYALDDAFYPENSAKKALINQRLFFETEKLHTSIKAICKPLVTQERKHILEADIEDVLQHYSYMEAFLETSKWMANDCITLADISLIPSVTTLDFLVPIDKSKFPKLNNWITRAKALLYYDPNIEGLNRFISLLSPFLG